MDKHMQERLDKLEKTVQEQAQLEFDALNSETDKKLNEGLASIKEEYEKIRSDKFKTQLRSIEQDANRQDFAAETGYKKRILDKKGEIVQKIMDGVLGKINEFVDSGEYREYLVQSIGNATAAAGGKKSTVYITQRDGERYWEHIRGKFQEIEMKPRDGIIGGCVVESEGLLVDNSIQGKMDEEKEKLREIIK